MHYDIFNEQKYKINKKKIDKVVAEFIKVFDLNNENSLSVAFVSPEEIRRLNRQYRKKDKITDVLSFSELDSKQGFVDPVFLGEVIVCYEVAVTQAKDLGHSVDDEIARLLAHGLVHLMGYDHGTDEEEKSMVEKENDILKIL